MRRILFRSILQLTGSQSKESQNFCVFDPKKLRLELLSLLALLKSVYFYFLLTSYLHVTAIFLICTALFVL